MTTTRSFNPFQLSDKVQQCPYELYAEMRAEGGLPYSSECNGFYFVGRYEDARQVLLDGENFSVSQGVGLMGPIGFILPESDGELHNRYRRRINPWFKRSAVEKQEPRVRKITKELLDALEGRDEIEFVTEVCRPIIALVNSKVVITVEDEQFDRLQELIHYVVYDVTKAREGLAGIKEFAAADIARRRKEPPRGDALDGIIHDTSDEPLTDEEAIKVYLSLLFGAFDTTANTLAVAFAYLAQHPKARAFLREDPSRIPTALEEFVRWDPTSQGMARTVVNAITVGGQQLRPGDKLFVCNASANRDEAQFPHADTVDLVRNPNRHLGFGAGPHRCVGVHLANVLMRVAVEEVLDRWPEMSLAQGAELRYRTAQLRSLIALPITPRPAR